MSTPRTDAATVHFRDGSHPMDGDWVPAEKAKELERELAEANRDRAIVGENAIKETSVLRKERDQWREVADKLAEFSISEAVPIAVWQKYNKLKEASK